MNQTHEEFKQAMGPYRGRTLATSRINEITGGDPALTQHLRTHPFPSDHCNNHTNKGACECACSEDAIFEKVERGVYRVR